MNRKSTKKMFELATDFSKLTKVPKYLHIDKNWSYEESQKNAVKFIKSLICRNIEVPNDEQNEKEYVGLEWKIDYKTKKDFWINTIP